MSNVEMLGIALAIAGVIVSIYFGLRALGSRQVQKAKGSGINIQSGGDTKINDR